MFRIGYNTNGFAHHRPLDALRLLAEIGYEGVALTPDAGFLDPYGTSRGELAEFRRWSEDLGLELAVETGARFLLDARRKHRPNLLEVDSDERGRRTEFLLRSLEVASVLGAKVLSCWAGTADNNLTLEALPEDDPQSLELLDRLAEGLSPVLQRAQELDVQVAFEPEPGMFIEKPQGYERLVGHMGSDGDALGLCLDVGHLMVTGDLPVRSVIEQYGSRLVHVHLDDASEGVHEHLMFGEGSLDLEETLHSLAEQGFDGMAAVELSRHSHCAPSAAAEALEHLRLALGSLPQG